MEGKWGFAVGDRVNVGRRVRGGRSWAVGEVLSVYEKYMLIQLNKYRVTVSHYDLIDGTAQVKKAS